MSLYLSDWEVVSPLGVGKAAFASGTAAAEIDAYRTATSGGDAVGVKAPAAEPVVFQDFDKRTYLGKKGVRNLDTLCAYATVASHLLVNSLAEEWMLSAHGKARTGVVLGTGTGSVRSQLDFICELHRQEQVEWVDPVQFPQTVMNCAAGQVGIWHGFTGVNVTVSGGYQSGITALQYARNLLRQGRVDRVLAGCAEEFSAYSSFQLPLDSRGLRSTDRLGEGCAMFLALAQRQRASDVEVLALQRYAHFRRYSATQVADHLVQTIGALLQTREQSTGRPRSIARICFNRLSTVGAAGVMKPAEDVLVDALRVGLPQARGAMVVCSNDVVADCIAATTGLQLGLLFVAGTPPVTPACDLVLTFDPFGAVGMALLEYGEQ